VATAENREEKENERRLARRYIGVTNGARRCTRSRWRPSARENGLEAARLLAGAHAARCPAVISRSTVALSLIFKFKLFLSNYF
jgi:hypothetical protein